MSVTLGTLKQVDLRQIWITEDKGFTPWLAKEENLKILSDTISIELELEAQEKDVGPFRADILCKNMNDDTWVLIENQIERTDHKHLGQLLTYAAGLEAVTIVWITAKFTEEHRKALDWLNEITDEDFRFFGLEVELWQVNDSLPAPKFNIVSKPNDWSKKVKRAAQEIEDNASTPTKELRVKYWKHLEKFMSDHDFHRKLPHTRPVNWQDFLWGRRHSFLRLSINARDGYLTAGLHLPKTMSGLYDILLSEKSEIEKELGFSLEWRDDPYPILNARMDANPALEDDWDRQNLWIQNTLEKLEVVFSRRVKSYTPSGDIDLEAA